ncbi:hypothetical protein AB0K09_03730 [Streptomyces sp. NPDC049577]|uniref:hypothetical protein n=1 Tax=Streptomyces sp. NPDC049577 TaxID=3155153 RepID=UPI003422ED3B
MTQSGQGNEPQPRPAHDGVARSPLPPEVPGGDSEATQYLPPVGNPAGSPPIPGAPGVYGAYGASSSSDATQLLPPTRPPGEPAPFGDADPTQFLPPVGGAPFEHSEPTQVLPPVTGPSAEAGRSTPAEFDTLFRSSAAAATQRFSPLPPPPGAGPAPTPPHGAPPAPATAPRPAAVPPHSAPPAGPHAAQYAAPPPPPPAARRRFSPAVIVGAVVAGCAVAGLGAGALLSGGGDKSGPQNAAAASDAPGGGTSQDDGGAKDGGKTDKPADPAEAQAKALDALLKDSGSSRGAVIKAVDATRACKDLDKSATDLRDAAGQRNGLVTRLQQTTVDKLPSSTELTGALTKAWQASASADTHYAAWADQVRGKHGCVKGHARPSGDSVAGDRASGDATAAKKRAADLWAPIAQKYGLPKREWTQL